MFNMPLMLLQIQPTSSFFLLELSESDIVGIFAETLSAKRESVFSNDAMLVGTHATLSAARTITSRMREPHFAVHHLGQVLVLWHLISVTICSLIFFICPH